MSQRLNLPGLIVLIVFGLIITGCDYFDAERVNFSQDDVIPIGAVQTLKIRQRNLASLPETLPEVDPIKKSL